MKVGGGAMHKGFLDRISSQGFSGMVNLLENGTTPLKNLT
jgi:hypothetical protein